MVLKLLQALPEDAPKITLLLFNATYPEDPFVCMTYPQGPTPEAMEHRYDDIAHYFDEPTYEQWKVIDTEIPSDENGNEIVAWCRWRLWKNDGPLPGPHIPSQGSSEEEQKSGGSFVDADFLTQYADKQIELRNKYYCTKRHMLIHWLCTRPEHQRRGAATMLLNAAMDTADREELELWALASPMILSSGGASNMGFEPVEAWNYDPGVVGKERPKDIKWPLRKVLMKRTPHKWM